MTQRRTGIAHYLGAAAFAVAAIAMAQNVPFASGSFSPIPAAYAQGQGKGGSQGMGGQGGGQGMGGQQGVGGQRGGASGVGSSVLHGNGGGISSNADEESDRPAWAGMKGGKSGGGTKPGTAGTKKGDIYGDLWVVLRDANGVPILDQYGHVQPLDAEGNLIPLDASGVPLDPTKVVEVELSRLSVAKAPSKITDKSYDEAIAALNSASAITVDDAGRLVVTVNGVTSTIDSPLENLALYKTLLSTGYLPGLTASDAVLGTLVALKNPSFSVTDYEMAAAFLGAASDKTGAISKDTVAYMDTFLKVTGTITGPDGLSYVDFSTFTYNRAATYPGTVTILVSNGDGTYTSKEVSLLDAVFSGTNYTGTSITAFSQAADDARAVINFTHENPVPASE